MDEERTWNENAEESEEDRSILSEQDLDDLDSLELDLEDEEAEERKKLLKRKMLIIAGAALFAAAVTITVLFLTRNKKDKD